MIDISDIDDNNSESNFFSSDLYLISLAKVYFPDSAYTIEEFKLGSKYYRLLVINGKKIITWFSFMDFLGNIISTEKKVRPIGYLPKVVLATKSYDSNNPRWELSQPIGHELAPYIDWHKFDTFDHFEKMLYQRNPKIITDSRRRREKLIREDGEITFIFNDPNPEVLNKCIKWKSTHYDDIGGTDMFLDPNHSRFFSELQKNGLVVVSSLSVKNKVIAAHIGAIWNNSFYYWIPAYDRSYSNFAPGRLLLHFLLKETYSRKYSLFDFLLGSENYKWQYTTDYRIIGPLGKPSFKVKLINILGKCLANLKSKLPYVYYKLKSFLISIKKIYFLINHKIP